MLDSGCWQMKHPMLPYFITCRANDQYFRQYLPELKPDRIQLLSSIQYQASCCNREKMLFTKKQLIFATDSEVCSLEKAIFNPKIGIEYRPKPGFPVVQRNCAELQIGKRRAGLLSQHHLCQPFPEIGGQRNPMAAVTQGVVVACVPPDMG